MTSGVSRVARSHSFRPYRSFGAIVLSSLLMSHKERRMIIKGSFYTWFPQASTRQIAFYCLHHTLYFARETICMIKYVYILFMYMCKRAEFPGGICALNLVEVVNTIYIYII